MAKLNIKSMVVAFSLIIAASCAPTLPVQTVAAAKPMTWADLLARPRPAADKSFRYGDDPYQVVDLWRPAGPGPHPVVLMIHGGCWTTSIADRTLMNWAAADLRARGVAVWNIDYRGVDRPGGAPDGIFRDVAAAADLLRAHATAEKLDLRRVIAAGHSAGGHLALWLAGRKRPAVIAVSRPLRVSHVVSLGGLPDLEQALDEKQGCGVEPVARLMGAATGIGLRDRRALLADKSIPLMAPLGVPQTLVNGDADRIIPTHFAADYAAKMRAEGDEVTVRIVPNQGHVELIAPGTPAWAGAARAIEGALRR
ncbi:MAG: hypothetical protein AVDCRST_MAG91-781 [uncultured Sphingomonadaceae bacterium]|uniref:BD-FAE-like domain-containing protein n=1 Tax=uncultured Sphingomonadaceae bacterium TaxID=169976 RepID=A0A6J4SCI2_9SPHN|nr:MAG: hypothetical protein AVDCRST_MAG91-781 [uncultured Sphingomonadaceae bacterium]